MGKRIIPRRRGRGRRYKAADNRFKGDARHPRSKSSNGKVVELFTTLVGLRLWQKSKIKMEHIL